MSSDSKTKRRFSNRSIYAAIVIAIVAVAAITTWQINYIIHKPAFSVSISPMPSTLDVGQSQAFTSKVTGGTSSFSYQWYMNGTAISGANKSIYMFTPTSPGCYNFCVKVTDKTGVQATSNTTTATVRNVVLYANLPPMNLTLVGASGTQKVIYASDIAKLTPFTGEGGFENSVGSIGGVGNYTGVLLTSLCNLVGGIGANDSVEITASDGYSMVFSYNQTKGNGFTTYDPTTGVEVPNEGNLTLVLAYHENGENLTYDNGAPLRLVILGKEGLLTDGHYWVKWISGKLAEIQIIPAVINWTLTLKDISEVNSTRIYEYNITRSFFEAGEAPNCHGISWTDGSGNVWTGIPLLLLVGSVDDWNFSMSPINESLAKSNGYNVTVISQSGGSRTFNSSYVLNSNSSMIVANELNGAVLPPKYWPLILVGSAVRSNDMVVNIVEIELVFLGS